MISTPVYRCARPWRRLWAPCLALVMFCGLGISQSFATSIFSSIFGSNSGSYSNSNTPSVELKVSDSAGPIDVDYDDLGTYQGLRTIKVQEKLFQPNGGGELNLWSDIEIQVCVDLGDDYDHGNPFDDIFDHIDDIIDDIFGFLNKGKSYSSSSNYSSSYGNGYDDEDEDDPEDGLDILVKKYVKNKAHTLFSDFRMVLGTGVGDDFVPSDPNDGLYFLTSPTPTETTNYFQNPPLGIGPNSDSLHWTTFGSNAPGLDHHDEALFKVGVHVPASLFEETDRDDCCDGFVARFTIRQHAEVPEPSALTLIALGGVTASVRRRRQTVES